MDAVKNHSTDLVCSKCGHIFTIYRYHGKRKINHVKDLWCINCKEQTKHIELQDAYGYKKSLEFKTELTSREQFLYDLMFDIENEEREKDFQKIFKRQIR